MNGIGFDKRVVRSQDDARLREKIFSDGRLAGCALTYTGKNLTIGIGHMVVKGRILAFDAAETVASDTTEAAGYGRLKLVIDLSQTASETEFTQYAWDWDYAATNSFPALTQDDINDGTHTDYEMVICIVRFTSSNISSITSQMATVSLTAPSTDFTATLSTTWTGASAPYSQNVTVTGLTGTRKIFVALAEGATDAEYLAAAAAQMRCTAKTTSQVTIKAHGTKPTVTLPIIVREVD